MQYSFDWIVLFRSLNVAAIIVLVRTYSVLNSCLFITKELTKGAPYGVRKIVHRRDSEGAGGSGDPLPQKR